jgi:peptide/nickel transport system permease protein
MLSYIRKRLVLAIPTIVAVSFVTFFLGYFAPASPVDILLGQHSDPATRARLQRAYGLDRPALVQYGDYVWKAAHGDFGRSFANENRPVTQILAAQFPNTALLATLSLVAAILIGIPTGLLAALKHNRIIDRAVMAVVLLFVSLPPFVLAPILILILSLYLGWLPSSGWDGPEYIVLPVLVLAARPAALLARLMRSSTLDVMKQDFVRTARAKGLAMGRVIRRHVIKNALLPVLTALGNQFGYLLTGSFVVESVFGIPGIGRESVACIPRRDYPVIQGMALLVAVIFILVNLLVDLLYAVVDPRVRYEESR